MKKKTIYQSNILWQLLCLVFLAISIIAFVIGIQLIIGAFNKGLGETATDVVVSIIIIACIFFFGFLLLIEFIRLEHNNIHLTSEKIYMNDDWQKKKNKIQFYAEVKFVDIESIDIIWMNKNSQGKPIQSRLVSAIIQKPYLSIMKKNGKVVNFFIMYISKKDIVKLVNEIRRRMHKMGNNIDIIGKDEVLLKLYRKKHKSD